VHDWSIHERPLFTTIGSERHLRISWILTRILFNKKIGDIYLVVGNRDPVNYKVAGQGPKSCRAPFGRFDTDSQIQACPSLIPRPQASFFFTIQTPQCTHTDSNLLSSHTPLKMAAAIKAINAKIRSNKVLDYFCSTRKLLSLLPPQQITRCVITPTFAFALPKVFVFLVLLSPLESQ
jgi:hypothetical protein